MIPELGQFALMLALGLAFVQTVFPLIGAQTNKSQLMAVATPAAAGQFVLVALAFGVLTHAFLQHDFSVLYVANHSNSALPAFYRVAAVWGGHEGSLLLWALVLCIWTVAVAAFSKQMPERFRARVIGVLGFVSIGFLTFMLFTSNPFDRLLPPAADGADLNPLLQDPALAIHPPMLYVGYVGFSVAFAFAVAAMLEGRLDEAWARWTRPWTTAAWLFLTLGIALGSWWAYYELGWGGWWFWDPVENASFMPWLVGTALIHSLAVTEKRGLFKSWTLLLAISAFSLSLLGTFLVRSGVLVSVHAFATDPTRGLYILMFLLVVVGGALALYAWRAPSMSSDAGFKLMSRETFLLANNVLLVVAAGLILLGTLYPLFIDALGLGKISVGPPYFDAVFLIPMVPLIFLVGVGMHTTWKRTDGKRLRQKLMVPAIIALVIGGLLPWVVYGGPGVLTKVGTIAAVWVIATAVLDLVLRWRRSSPAAPMTRGHLGMCVAHLGLGLFILGVAFVESYGIEIDRTVRAGDSVEVGGFSFEFQGTRHVEGPNFTAVEGEFLVRRNASAIGNLYPQKRVYRVQQNPMTEADIDAGWRRDLFVAMGDPLGDGAWSVRVQYKPFIRFIWFGCLVMAIGGLIAMTDRRYRLAQRREAEVPAGQASPA